MALFAASYGELTKRIGATWRIEFHLKIFSCALSIIVGSLWLVLSYFGLLDEVFG